MGAWALGQSENEGVKSPGAAAFPSRRVDEKVACGVTVLSTQQLGVPQLQAKGQETKGVQTC
jgi:hypothetical protein